MKELVCKMCNSNEIVKKGDLYVCESCGTKYTTEEAEKLSVEVVVKNDNSERVEALKKAANRAKDMKNWESAAKYYEEILALDPDDWQAVFYSAFCVAMSCKIAQIISACQLVINSYRPTFKILKENMSEIRQEADLMLMAFDVVNLAKLMNSASISHYNGIGDSIRLQYRGELSDRCTTAANVAFLFGDLIEEIFGSKFLGTRTIVYKTGVEISDTGVCNIKREYIDKILDIIEEDDADYVAEYRKKCAARKEASRKEAMSGYIIYLVFGIIYLVLGVVSFFITEPEPGFIFLKIFFILLGVVGVFMTPYAAKRIADTKKNN